MKAKSEKEKKFPEKKPVASSSKTSSQKKGMMI